MDENTMDKQSSPKSSLFDGWNAPPNLVTYSRIVLVVFFLTLDILAGAWGENNLTMRWVAAVLFIIAASTDKIDGWMARKYNQVTEMGKLMDPIADKLLTCGAMIVCSAFGELGWWVTILFLIREIGITVMRFFVMERPAAKSSPPHGPASSRPYSSAWVCPCCCCRSGLWVTDKPRRSG